MRGCVSRCGLTEDDALNFNTHTHSMMEGEQKVIHSTRCNSESQY